MDFRYIDQGAGDNSTLSVGNTVSHPVVVSAAAPTPDTKQATGKEDGIDSLNILSNPGIDTAVPKLDASKSVTTATTPIEIVSLLAANPVAEQVPNLQQPLQAQGTNPATLPMPNVSLLQFHNLLGI